MTDLSEKIRIYVDSVCPPLKFDDLSSQEEKGKERLKKPRGRRIVAPMGVAAAIIAVVLAIVLQVIPNSPREPNAAAAVLEEAAHVAAVQRPLTTGRHRYLYYEVTNGSAIFNTYAPAGQQPFIVRDVETTETWVAPNGSGRQRITTNDSLVLASQRPEWKAGGSRKVIPPGPSDTTFPTTFFGQHPVGGPMTLGPRHQWYLAYPQTSFPTQPRALERAIERFYKVSGGPQTVFELAGDVLQVESPSLRSAIFQMVKQLPGVRLLGTIKDRAGRAGVGVAISGAGVRHVLIFNLKTSAVLGEEILATRATTFAGVTLPKGTVLGYETFGRIGVTSSVTEFPKR